MYVWGCVCEHVSLYLNEEITLLDLKDTRNTR